MADALCSTCLRKRLKRPLRAAYSDGRCFNHTDDPLAKAKRDEAGQRGGEEAKARKAKGIAGKGKGMSAADAPERLRVTGRAPDLDVSSPAAFNESMRRIIEAVLNGDIDPDAAKGAHPYCETVGKLLGGKNAGAATKEQGRKVITFRDVPAIPTH